jgi:disulfide bond formation protein DsbB
MLAPSQGQNSAGDSTGALGFWRRNAACAAALIVAIAGALTIAGAWFFQLVIGLKPCPMCLEQRWPYYVGIPLALAVAFAAQRKAPRAIVVLGLVGLAALMLWGAYMGAFHAGVEWKLWLGPAECTGTPEFGGAGGLLNRLQNINITRCDEAAWRFLGLSLAGYNALISLALAAVALVGAKAACARS